MGAFNTAPPPGYLDDDTDPLTPVFADRRYAIPPPGYLASNDPNGAPPPPPVPAPATPPALPPPDSAAPAPPPPFRPDPGYERSMRHLEDLYAQRPELSQPKWWQRALGAGAGFGAGWSNAASRSRNPIDIGAMRDNILAPGYSQKLAQWQSRVQPAQAVAEMEANRQQMAIDQNYKQAEAEAQRQHGLYWAHRAQSEQNQWKIDPKTGSLYNTITGERSTTPATPADVFNQRLKVAKDAHFDDDKAQYYAATGSLTGYGSTLANPTPNRNLNPSDILLHPGDFDPSTVSKAQQMFNAEHRAPADKSGGPARATPGQFARIESTKNSKLAKAQSDANKQLAELGPGATAEEKQAIYDDLNRTKQQLQNDYEGEVEAAGGQAQHYEYGAPTRPAAAAPTPTSNKPATPAPPRYTEAQVRAAAVAKHKDPDAAVRLARERKLIS